jgi:hypothetical protein
MVMFALFLVSSAAVLAGYGAQGMAMLSLAMDADGKAVQNTQSKETAIVAENSPVSGVYAS